MWAPWFYVTDDDVTTGFMTIRTRGYGPRPGKKRSTSDMGPSSDFRGIPPMGSCSLVITKYISFYIYIYLHTYMCMNLSLSPSPHVYVCVYICIYFFIYVYSGHACMVILDLGARGTEEKGPVAENVTVVTPQEEAGLGSS